jgi:hypothetical protein
MSKEALKLASALDHWATQMDMGRKPDPKSLTRKASAELRRLQAELDAIKQALAAQPVQEPVASAAYDMVDRFLRNNLSSDADYAEYSAALDALYTTPPAQPAPVQEKWGASAVMNPDYVAAQKEKSQQALDVMAENARELGLDYEPADGTQVSKVWWDGEKLMAKPIPFVEFYKAAPAPGYCRQCKQYSIEEPLPAAQRQWVGLTDEERNTIGRHHAYVDNIIRATEAKLKEKNT